MLNKKPKSVPTVCAYLKEEITYQKDGRNIVVPKNTTISVDTNKSVALVNGDHVDIFPEEYQIIIT